LGVPSPAPPALIEPGVVVVLPSKRTPTAVVLPRDSPGADDHLGLTWLRSVLLVGGWGLSTGELVVWFVDDDDPCAACSSIELLVEVGDCGSSARVEGDEC